MNDYMKKTKKLFLSSLLFLFAIFEIYANNIVHKPDKADTSKLRYMPGELLVKIKSDDLSAIEAGATVKNLKISDRDFDRLNKDYGVYEIKKLRRGRGYTRNGSAINKSGQVSEVILLRFNKTHDPFDVALQYATLANVEYAEPNYVYYTSETVPNDPDYDDQWNLHKVQASTAWDHEQGDRNVVIGILDTGVDWDHPDLSSQIWINLGEDVNGNGIIDASDFNGVDDDHNGYIDDLRGWDFVEGVQDEVAQGEDGDVQDNNPMDFYTHGTHCAGIAASAMNNSIGVAGIAPGCTIIPLRAGFAMPDGGGALTTEAISEALYYAADNGVNILSMSFGGDPFSKTDLEAYQYAYSKGVILIAAAGNSSSSAEHYPSAYPNVIAVSATGPEDEMASFSNYGNWVDVSAPGENILSTIYNDEYAKYSGTSMSTPLVAGLTALIQSAHPEWSDEDVEIQLLSTTDDIDTLNQAYKWQLGTGRINAAKALTQEASSRLRVWDTKYDYFYNSQHSGLVDSMKIRIDLSNLGKTATGVYIKMSCNNQYVTLITDSLFYGDILYGDTAILNRYFTLLISPDVPVGECDTLEYAIFSAGVPAIIAETGVILNNPYMQQTGFPAKFRTHPDLIKTADVDNDGQAEIICLANSDGIYRTETDGSVKKIIYFTGYQYTVSSFALADLDNDGNMEIIFQAILQHDNWEVIPTKEKVFAYHHNGSLVKNWPVTLTEKPEGGVTTFYQRDVVLTDLDGNSDLEIIVTKGLDPGTIILNHDGSLFTPWMDNKNAPSMVFNQFSVADLDNDGDMEIVGSVNNEIISVHHDGKPFPQQFIGNKGLITNITLADIDGDKDYEIIASSMDGILNIWHHNGRIFGGWPVELFGRVEVMSADLDSDGEYEIVTVNHKGVNVYNYHGELKWSREIEGQKSKPVIGDINGDGNPDVIFAMNESSGFDPFSTNGDKISIHIFGSDGSYLPLWPQNFNGATYGMDVLNLDDIDRDGDIELICAGFEFNFELQYYSAMLYCINSIYNFNADNLFWPTGSHDNQNTRFNPVSLSNVRPSIPEGILPAGENGHIRIKWIENPESDIAGYNLYRRMNNAAGYVKQNQEAISDTTFLDEDILQDTVYHYVVTALDNPGQESEYSEKVSFSITDPSAPKGLTAIPGVGSARLFWISNSEPDITGYNVYKAEIQALNFVKINSQPVVDTIYTDNQVDDRLSCFYYVTAVNTDGSESWRSDIVRVVPGLFTRVQEFSNESKYQPDMCFADINNDGDEDLLIEAVNKILIYENISGFFTVKDTVFTRITTDFLAFHKPVELDLRDFTMGDVNSDGYIDLIIASSNAVEVHLNDGAGKFKKIYQFIDQYYNSIWYDAITLKDIDDDGDLDLIGGGNYPLVLFKNNGNGYFIFDREIFKERGESIYDITSIDYNEDGFNDVVYSGIYTRIFKNDGNGMFQAGDIYGNSSSYENMAYADLDYDGKQDIVIGASLFRNEGDGNYSPANILYKAADLANITTIGDFGGDGRYDLICGSDSLFFMEGGDPTIVFDHIIREWNEGNIGYSYYRIKSADIDNDGDLDMGLASQVNEYIEIYRNNSAGESDQYNKPLPPETLTGNVSGGSVILNWSAGSDTETPANGLTYNLRVGNSEGGVEIISPVISQGYGNYDNRLSANLNLPSKGTYYWSVQTVDAGYLKSEWAAEQLFIISEEVAPKVDGTYPHNGEKLVPTEMEILVYFNKEMDKNYIPSDAFEVNTNSGLSQGTIRYIDTLRAFAFKPDQRIEPSQWGNIHTIHVRVGKFKDIEGNEMQPYEWSFGMFYEDVHIKEYSVLSNDGYIRQNSVNEVEVTFTLKSPFQEWLFYQARTPDEYITDLNENRVYMGIYSDGSEWKKTISFWINEDCPDNHEFSLGFLITALEIQKWLDTIDLAVGHKYQAIDDPILSDGMVVYPNPVSDIINIVFSEDETIQRAELVDLKGTVLLIQQPRQKKNRMSLSVTSVPEGTYILRVITDKEIINKKVSVVR
jgi:subtilisin family serine protease